MQALATQPLARNTSRTPWNLSPLRPVLNNYDLPPDQTSLFHATRKIWWLSLQDQDPAINAREDNVTLVTLHMLLKLYIRCFSYFISISVCNTCAIVTCFY